MCTTLLIQYYNIHTLKIFKQKRKRMGIPVWSPYNSLISNPMVGTKVRTPPLLAAPVHEWPSLLTILMQEQNITASFVGPGRKTVICLDVGLYRISQRKSFRWQETTLNILYSDQAKCTFLWHNCAPLAHSLTTTVLTCAGLKLKFTAQRQ